MLLFLGDVGDFPLVAVEVGEVGGVAPGFIFGPADLGGSGGQGGFEDVVDFLAAFGEVADDESGRFFWLLFLAGEVLEGFALVEDEAEAALEFEEAVVGEAFADAFGGQAEAVAVEGDGFGEVGDGQGDEVNFGFHGFFL